jgi:hypothetical protein
MSNRLRSVSITGVNGTPSQVAAAVDHKIMLAVLGCILAGATPLVMAQDEPPHGVIAGSVHDALSSLPVAGVAVSLHGPQIHKGTKTDPAGSFRFEHLPAGRYELGASKLGYVGSDYDRRQIAQVNLKSDATPERVTFHLLPTATVDGLLLDEEKRPLDGVHLYAQRRAGGLPLLATTENGGRFILEHLRPGDYTLEVRVPYSVRKRLLKRKATGELLGYANSQFYPGVDDAALAAPLPLPPGTDLRDLHIRLQRSLLVGLTGRLLDGVTQEPLAGAEVELEPASGGLTDETYSRRSVRGPRAEFSFELIQPGRYSVLVYRDSARTTLPYVVPLDLGVVGEPDLRIAVPPSQRIDGKVHGLDDEAVTIGLGSTSREVRVGADGSFHLDDVPPGRWWLGVQAGGLVRIGSNALRYRLYVAKLQFGSQTSMPLVVSESGNPTLEIWLSDQSGTLAGAIQEDDQRLRNAAVVLVRGAGGLYRLTPAQDGSFVAKNLPPGEYQVTAVTGDAEDACRDRAVTVKVAHGTTSVVQLRLCSAQ